MLRELLCCGMWLAGAYVGAAASEKVHCDVTVNLAESINLKHSDICSSNINVTSC